MKKRVFLKCIVNKEVRTLNVTEKTITGLGDNVELVSTTTLVDSSILIYKDVDIDNQNDNSSDNGHSGSTPKKSRGEKAGDNGPEMTVYTADQFENLKEKNK